MSKHDKAIEQARLAGWGDSSTVSESAVRRVVAAFLRAWEPNDLPEPPPLFPGEKAFVRIVANATANELEAE